MRGLALMGTSDLVEHLPERAHPRAQVTDNPVHLRGLIETSAGVSQSPQRLGRLSGVGGRIEERGHGGPPESCYSKVRTRACGRVSST
ncbi:MAG: hypothetical protein WC184_09200 [Acidimicrobiia bacterium]